MVFSTRYAQNRARSHYAPIRVLSFLACTLLLNSCGSDNPPADVILAPTSNPFHIVQRGETLSSIAEKYNMKKIALIRLNRLKPPYRIFINQRLIIIPKEAGVQQAHAAAVPPRQHKASVADSGDVTVRETHDATYAENTDTSDTSTHTYTPTMGSGIAGSPTASPYTSHDESQQGMVSGGDHAASISSSLQPQTAPSPTPPAAASGTLSWPVQGQVIKGFGPDATGHRNDGINVSAPLGTPVHAVSDGVVAHVGNHTSGFGNLVLIKHNDGKISVYGHLKDTAVKAGDPVSHAQTIGSVGTSGGVAQPQLHFELRQGKKPLNPTEYLK